MISIDRPERHFTAINFKDRFPALDGLRAIAILSVFLYHFGGGSHGGRVLNMLNQLRLRGGMGVDLFFVLSGFLITGILYDTRNDSHYFKRFFARRSLRIFPVFYLVVAFLLILTPFLQYEWKAGHLLFLVYFGNLLGDYDFSYYGVVSANHPTFKADFGHFWTLCVEEQFYLLWPIAVWAIKDRIKLVWTALSLIVLAIVLREAMVLWASPLSVDRWVGRSLPFRMDELLVGGVMALLLRGPAAERWQKSSKYFLLTFGAMMLVYFYFFPALGPNAIALGYTVNALAFAGLIGCTLRRGSFAFRFFNQKPLRILGKYSYGFYVFHAIYEWAWIQFLVLLTNKFHSKAIAGVLALTINFVTTFLLAKLSYDYFESYFLRFKDRFAYDSELADAARHHSVVHLPDGGR